MLRLKGKNASDRGNGIREAPDAERSPARSRSVREGQRPQSPESPGRVRRESRRRAGRGGVQVRATFGLRRACPDQPSG